MTLVSARGKWRPQVPPTQPLNQPPPPKKKLKMFNNREKIPWGNFGASIAAAPPTPRRLGKKPTYPLVTALCLQVGRPM